MYEFPAISVARWQRPLRPTTRRWEIREPVALRRSEGKTAILKYRPLPHRGGKRAFVKIVKLAADRHAMCETGYAHAKVS